MLRGHRASRPHLGGLRHPALCPPHPKKKFVSFGIGVSGMRLAPQGWVRALSLELKAGIVQGPPLVGCHAPRCQPRPGPVPPPTWSPQWFFVPLQMLQLNFPPPSSPLRVSFPPRVPTSPTGVPQPPLCSPSSLPLLSQFAPSLTSPTQLNFWGSDHHTKPHVPAMGRAARAKYSVSPSCGHPRCHPNFHPGVVGSAKPPAGHFMGEKKLPTTQKPVVFFGGEMVPKFTRTVPPGVPGS